MVSFPKNLNDICVPLQPVIEKMTLSDICILLKDYSFELDKIYNTLDIKAIIDDDDNETLKTTIIELNRSKLSLEYATKFLHGIKYLLE